MEYLLAWRMAVAKDLLRRHDLGIAEVAERVGYGAEATSASRSPATSASLRVVTRRA
jgi:AraC-like DNA-binding protein